MRRRAPRTYPAAQHSTAQRPVRSALEQLEHSLESAAIAHGAGARGSLGSSARSLALATSLGPLARVMASPRGARRSQGAALGRPLTRSRSLTRVRERERERHGTGAPTAAPAASDSLLSPQTAMERRATEGAALLSSRRLAVVSLPQKTAPVVRTTRISELAALHNDEPKVHLIGSQSAYSSMCHRAAQKSQRLVKPAEETIAAARPLARYLWRR